MTKHKLDEEVEDILQHYGIKGMKWDVIRTPEQIAAAKNNQEASGGGDSGEEEDDDDSIIDDAKQFLSSMSKDIKKAGKNILDSIFGKKDINLPKGWKVKRGSKLKKLSPDKQKEFNTMMKIASRSKSKADYKKNVKAYKHATRKGGTTTKTLGMTTSTVKKDGYGKGVVTRTTPLYGQQNAEADRKSAYRKEAERKRKSRN